MSDLPDLDTSQISFIAYWNAIDDGGAPSIDPEDVLTDGNINEYTLYDNGIHIDSYTSTTGRDIQARVKTDGWMVAYLDRTADFNQTTSLDNCRGWWDLAANWNSNSSNSDFDNHTLSRAISSLTAEFSNNGMITFNHSDVGLYNYQYPDATTVTGMSEAQTGSTANPGFSFTSDTTIHAAVVAGATSLYSSSYVEWQSTKVAGTADPGALDITSDLTDSGVEYQLTVNSNSSNQDTHGTIIVLWS